MRLPSRFAVHWMAVALCSTRAVMAQTLVDLCVEGPTVVLEGTSADYKAIATFDNGDEFEVTLFADWWVDDDTYAWIDQFGHLTTEKVEEDQPITVLSTFTWDRVTLDAALEVTLLDVPANDGDPWPFWGRTATRIGNTATVGPQTPRIEWSVLISSHPAESILEASPVMDSEGRVFIGTIPGVSAVDSAARELLWEAMPGDLTRGVAVRDGRVVWGDFDPFSTIYCYDAATGEEIWTVPTGGAITAAPVIDPFGVIYISDQGANVLHARRIEDGSEVWTFPLGGPAYDSPALDWPELLTSGGGPLGRDLIGIDPVTGASRWSFETGREIRGTSVLHDGHVYVGSWDEYLYCLDAATGNEIWRFWCEQFNRGSIAIGHDGTIYTATEGNEGILFAVSPESKEHWRFYPEGRVFNPPIVGGDGTIYFCSQWPPDLGWVHAVRPDGSELWTVQMPNQVTASPMLAPDGTLFVVCRDKNLYAFKDAEVLGDLDGDGAVGSTDLIELLGSWGPCPDLPETCPADLDLDGVVGPTDLITLLGNWG